MGYKKSDNGLLQEALSSVVLKRHQKGILNRQVPLSLAEFAEVLSGSGVLYRYQVSRLRQGNNIYRSLDEVDEFISKIGQLANFGLWPNREQLIAILHPPFESFSAPKQMQVSEDVGEVVTQLVVDASEVSRPEGADAQIYQFPASDLQDALVSEATA